MKSIFKRVSALFSVTVIVAASISGCGPTITPDLSNFQKFVSHNFVKPVSSLSDTVDLYVDYSTCVAEAKNSNYFKSTHPAIVDCAPIFYSIKGSKITKETDDRQEVYQLLSSIREVNNADIKKAVQNIVNGNHQAVLITDGEYYLQGSVRDNLNNPYLADEFRTWLRKGYDVYIYSEPYLESGRYNKYRYYILFTDAKKSNNINDRFSRSAPDDDRVKMLHLSNGVPTVSFDEDYPMINEALSPVESNYIFNDVVELQEYGVDWNDMVEYLSYDKKNSHLLRGIYVNRTESDCYKIVEVEPVVYQVYDEYQEFCDSCSFGTMLPKIGKLRRIDDVFEIDEDEFEETGEIVLKLDDDFDGSSLSMDTPNLLKVDFVIEKASDNFSGNQELNDAYKWNSISAAQNHAQNTSIYESISQVIKDPQMNPTKKGHVVYTVYLSTYSL